MSSNRAPNYKLFYSKTQKDSWKHVILAKILKTKSNEICMAMSAAGDTVLSVDATPSRALHDLERVAPNRCSVQEYRTVLLLFRYSRLRRSSSICGAFWFSLLLSTPLSLRAPRKTPKYLTMRRGSMSIVSSYILPVLLPSQDQGFSGAFRSLCLLIHE